MWISEAERKYHSRQEDRWQFVRTEQNARKKAANRERKVLRNAKVHTAVRLRFRLNRRLWRFREDYKLAATKEKRIALLVQMSRKVFIQNEQRRKKLRSRFDEKKNLYYRLYGFCGVCNGRANVRHHIIQLQNGGGNHGLNLMRLCYGCHAEIHPWLKK